MKKSDVARKNYFTNFAPHFIAISYAAVAGNIANPKKSKKWT